MKILVCGDIVGRSGREAILEYIPKLREELDLDCIIVNGENAAHGFGINAKICQEFYAHGVDVVTSGNHIWAQREILKTIDQDARLLRPINYPAGTPGRGHTFIQTAKGKKIMVVNAMARTFMDPLDDPFSAIDTVLDQYPLGHAVQAIVIDFHGEATSEKMAMGHFCDGRATLVIGTHTHIPTADAQILDGGTAYQTDLGMCGDYNSVIGMKKETPIAKMTRRLPTKDRMTPALGPGTLCGVYVESDDQTGRATKIRPVRLGARLIEARP